MTGESNLTADPLLEYFEPLYDFLVIENARLKKEDEIRQKLAEYNIEASQYCRKRQLAEWEVITDINNSSKREAFQQAIANNAEFMKSQYEQHFRNLDQEDYPDEKVQRQIMYIKKLGINALNESQLNEWSQAKANMEKTYNNAGFCDYFKPNCSEKERMTLDPGNAFCLMIIIPRQ